jgi:hypothetical protein
MSDSGTTAIGPERGFLARFFGLYVSPGESFAEILKRPRFWAPLALMVALSVGFTAVWLPRVDPGEFVKAMLEERGQWDQIPPERRAAVLESAGGRFAPQAWMGAVLGPCVILLLTAVVLLFVFRFFYGGEVGFRQAMAVVSYTFAAVSLVTTPLTLLVLFLKGDWNLNPQDVLQANPTLLLEKESVARPLWALLGSLDLFSFWIIGLLAIGFGLAVRRPGGSALWGVVIPWLVLIVGSKVAFTALF